MAEVPELTVAVESAVHDALARVIQNISDRHHLQVTQVSVEWLETSTLVEFSFKLERIAVEAFSKPQT